MSTTTGGIGIALVLWGQLVWSERYAFHANNGHGMTDDIMLLALLPGITCAALALVLGVAGFRDRSSRTAWTIVGLVVGTIAVACTVSGVPGVLVPNPLIQPEVP